jgi:rhodanese-related sulfurtransferase
LWTTGTMTGISRFLKENIKNIYSLWVIRKPNNPIPWPRTKSLLQQIAFDWKSHVDQTIEVGTREAYARSLDLIRNWIVVWPSSGFALGWLFDFLKKTKNENALDLLRNKQWEIRAVFICCDSPYAYIDEYFTYLDDSYFPQIENEDILLYKDSDIKRGNIHDIDNYLIDSEWLFDKAIVWTKEDVQSKLEKNIPIELNQGWLMFDIRSEEEFSHFHIPWSQHILEKDIYGNHISLENKKIVVICRYWIKSMDIVALLRSEWYDAYSLQWWITERSNKLLPRWKPMVCFSSSKKS